MLFFYQTSFDTTKLLMLLPKDSYWFFLSYDNDLQVNYIYKALEN